MNEFDPNPASDADLDAAGRLVLALTASLALHLALVFGIQIRAPQPVEPARPAMEVRIESAPQAKVASVLLAESLPETQEDTSGGKPEPAGRDAEKPAPQPPAPVESVVPGLPVLEIPVIEDPTWYPAKQVDIHPAALQPIRPAYPDRAAEQGVEGSAVLLLLIDEAGRVKEVSVASADPEGYFEESALEAFRAARFAPAQKNGRAVKSRVLIRVTYELGAKARP